MVRSPGGSSQSLSKASIKAPQTQHFSGQDSLHWHVLHLPILSICSRSPCGDYLLDKHKCTVHISGNLRPL